MRTSAIILAGILTVIGPLHADAAPPIPELVIPDNAETQLPPGIVRRFGSGAFRHLGIGSASLSSSEPFFSPNGDTVYVPGNHDLIAFDVATGRIQFIYRYSLLNITIRNEGVAGVRVDFHQGPLSGQFVLLEHGTGRELQRGHQARQDGLQIFADFSAGKRALATRVVFERNSDPRGRSREKTTGVLLDVPNKQPLAELGSMGWSPVAVLSPDRRRLAFCTSQWQLKVFDTEDGRLLCSQSLGFQENSGESSVPVWSLNGKTVYVWRRNTSGNEIIAVDIDIDNVAVRVLLKDSRSRVYGSPAVSPDGRLLAYRINDNPWEHNSYWRIVRLQDLTEARLIDVRPAPTKAAFSPESRSFWLLGPCGLARFDLASGQFDPLSTDPFASTGTLAFSLDSQRLYEVAGAQVLTWDVTTGREIAPRTGFDAMFREQALRSCLYISPDGRRSIWKGKSRVHALVDGQIVGNFYAANLGRHEDYDLTPDHRLIVHNTERGELTVGDLWTGITLHELLPAERPRDNVHFTLAPDNRTLAIAYRERRLDEQQVESEIDFWDLQDGRKLGGIRQVCNHSSPMQFSQDSRELRVWDRGSMTVWNVIERSLIRRQEGQQSSYQLATTPNRHWTLNHSYRAGVPQLELIDLHTLQVAKTWDYPGRSITAITFSPNQTSFAIASSGVPTALYRLYEPRPEAFNRKRPTDEQLIELLGGTDAVEVFDAICELIRRGDDCLPMLHDSVTRAPLPPNKVADLINQLDSPEFAKRDAAFRALVVEPESVVPLLQAALKEGASPERRLRIEGLLTRHGSGDVSRDRLTAYRVVEILAAIGTPASVRRLEQLSHGDKSLSATREAIATLSRMKSE